MLPPQLKDCRFFFYIPSLMLFFDKPNILNTFLLHCFLFYKPVRYFKTLFWKLYYLHTISVRSQQKIQMYFDDMTLFFIKAWHIMILGYSAFFVL